MDLLKKSPKPTPGGIITNEDPSLATKIRRTRTNIGKQLLRTSSSPGRISSMTDGATIAGTRSSPDLARGVTYGEPPVLVPQATTTRPTPGPRPEEFENSVKRRKLTSSE